MAIIKYALLGLIQGLTEFFPVSSTAHLLIFRRILGISENQITLEVVLHLGTLLALIIFLFKDLKYLLQRKILFYIFLVSALTAGIVFLGQGFFESMFSAKKVALPMLITGIVLLSTQRRAQRAPRNFSGLRTPDAFYLGLVQGFSVIPGLSRSGLTISALLWRNLEKETAFKFSFLASIPVVLGAALLKINALSAVPIIELRYLAFGFLAAFFSGLLTLRLLFNIIRRARFYLFGYYCLTLGCVLLWIL